MGANTKDDEENRKMTKQDLIINIENYIDEICAHENGKAIVDFMLKKQGVTNIYDLTKSACQDLFNELFDIAASMD